MPAILDIPSNHFLPHSFRPSASLTAVPRSQQQPQRSVERATLPRQLAGIGPAREMARIGVAVASSLPHHYGGYSHSRPDVVVGAERRNIYPGTTHNNNNNNVSQPGAGAGVNGREDISQHRPPQRRPLALISQHSHVNQVSLARSPIKSQVPGKASPELSSSMTSIGGNLAELAAQVACLFWFAKASKVKQIEDGCVPQSPTSLFDLEFAPSSDFKKWVTSILATTQMSKNVILLALLFIYRLKKFNPTVRGKRGSEFRLMTIALMMGNKFLDDNTYTNKTWAEVSGLSVQEIHVMEVEFLSNVRYNLFVTKEEWDQWLIKVSAFSAYLENTSRFALDVYSASRSVHVSPTHSPLAASIDYHRPQLTQQAAKLAPPYTPLSFNLNHASMPLNGLQPTKLSSDAAPRLTLPGELFGSYRKRSRDEQVIETPSKRPATITAPWTQPPGQASIHSYQLPQTPHSTPSTAQTHVPTGLISLPSNMAPQLPRLLSTYPVASANTSGSITSSNGSQPVFTVPKPAIYPACSTPSHWSQTPSTQSSISPVHHLGVSGPGVFPTTSSSTTISPTVTPYSIRTPTHLSPSSILLDRNSPYRPVRTVNTLLYPPPSGSLLQPRQLPVDLMRYQPLGKRGSEMRSDRTGVLPYSQPNIWGEQYFSQVQPTTQTGPYHQV